MSDVDKDLAVATTLVERLRTQRIPTALEIKERVDRGGRLDERDLAFLHEVFEVAQQIMPLVDRHPEYRELYTQALQLYKEITDQALANEKTPPNS